MRAGLIGTVLDLRLWAALAVPLAVGSCGAEPTTSSPQSEQAAPQVTTTTQALLLPDGGIAAAPEGWTCSDESYYGGNGCDCGCGIPDPDCIGSSAEDCDTCNTPGSCSESYYGENYYGPFGGCPGVIDSFDNSICFDAPPQEWTCDAARYGTGNGCDCGCGVFDPDCEDGFADTCDTCTAGGSCADGNWGCDDIQDDHNAACNAPAEWVCDPAFYGASDGCDCGCGAVDPDCGGDSSVEACDYCDAFWGAGPCGTNCADINPADNAQCGGPGTPLEWTCEAGLYDNRSSNGLPGPCDCGCGVVDPDCANQAGPSCDSCDDPGSCAGAGCTDLDPSNNAACFFDCAEENDGTPCTDGNACTEGDQCLNGSCGPGTAVSCDDGASCTSDTCDSLLGCQNPTTCEVAAEWTCNPDTYGAGDGCDCGCGIQDPDCTGEGGNEVSACNTCSNDGSCASPLWDCQAIDDDDNSQCLVPGWTCNPSYYDDGPCDCGCGIVDIDCSNATVAVCDYCDGDGEGSCTDTSCADINPTSNASCGGPGVPGQWTCDPSLYFNPSSSDCECGCGVIDPDCSHEHADACDECSSEGSCAAEGCGDINPGDNAVCGGAPAEWTCDPEFYGAADGCDCGCGIIDPDCDGDSTVGACDYCDEGVCGAVSCAQINPTDNALCGGPGVPATWDCDDSLYYNPGSSGCDCGCGEVDPDCDDATVFACTSCNATGSCAEGDDGCGAIEEGDNAGCTVVTSCAGEADGTPCDDANACTSGEVCAGGSCTGGTNVCLADCTGQPLGTPCGGLPGECSFQSTCDGFGACVPSFKPVEADCGGIVDPNGCVNQRKCDGAGVCNPATNKAAGLECGDQSDTDCTNPDTCDGSGTCQANHEPDTITDCNGLVDPNGCQNQDKCVAGVCVDNGPRPNGQLCGGPAGALVGQCDAADTCGDGICLRNLVGAGAPCGNPSDLACDNPDSCDGLGSCAPNHESPDFVCRGAAGVCDVAETCGESTGACPGDAKASAGFACGDPMDRDCDNPDTCNGISNECQVNHEVSTFVCRDAAGVCDVLERCQGSTDACPADQKVAADTACGDGTDRECDNPDTCNGASNDCQENNEPPTFVCRGAGGVCDVEETCGASNTDCPADQKVAADTACGDGTDRECDNPDTCNGSSNNCQANNEPGDHVCRPDAGECDVADTCGESSDACPPDLFEESGFACGSNSDTVCDNPDTCDGSGSCQVNNEPADFECRASAGECDVAELCDGAGSCPDDAFKPATEVCEASAGACDIEETCTGSSAACPADVKSTASCRISAGECDVEEFCDGSNNECPVDAKSTSLCRAANGLCDVADFCDGEANDCPTDELRPEGFNCDGPGPAAIATCDNPNTCDGLGTCLPNYVEEGSPCGDSDAVCTNQDTCNGTGSCTDNGFKPSDTVCRDSQGVCDVVENCTGTGPVCPPDLKSTAECNAQNGVCDVAESCDGVGNDCPVDAVADSETLCRGASDVCDVAENCDGLNKDCPTDAVATTAVVCRPSTEASCDPQETCDGSTKACPANAFAAQFTACGVSTPESAACDAPDSCNADGTCNPRNAPPTQDCGDTGTQCRNQDKCYGPGALAGTCEDKGFVTAGVACGSPANTDCSNPDTCDGLGECDARNEGPTIDCNANSPGQPRTECENQDKCDNFGGTCLENGFRPNGAACGDPSNTTCTDPDTCNGAGTCQRHDAPVNTDCGDTGTQCRNQDKCDAVGQCQDLGFVAPGTPCGSPVDTVCSNPDSCDGAGTCALNNAPNTEVCRPAAAGDAGLCDIAELCNNGVCPTVDAKVAAGTTCRGTSGNECDVAETCDGATNACPANAFVGAGTGCGSPSDTECDNADTCNGSGTCLGNTEAPGTSCGDPSNTDCKNPDSCNGSGSCLTNDEIPGTACGSPGDTECDNPDLCDASGLCQTNNEADGSNCGSAGTECTNQDTCNGGSCTDNGFKAELTACGDPSDWDCDDPDSCDGSGTCLNRNKGSGFTCRDAGGVCDIAELCGESVTDCPADAKQANGTSCGSDNDTECDNPDTCNGTSVDCQVNNEPGTTNCGDTGTECTNQDKCNGSGSCTDNGFKPALTACGDGTDRDCDNPDSCNGSGACLARNELSTFVCRGSGGVCDIIETCGDSTDACPDDAVQPNNTACGSSGNTDCDNPDTCNGSAKDCQPNNEPNTTTCGDTGTECTNQDFCSGTGSCTDFGHKAGGTACGSNSDTDCDNADSCNGSGTCLANNEPNTTNCGDTGTECTNQDKCSGTGTCSDNGYKPDGSFCGSSNDTQCDNRDTCNGAGTCQVNNEPNTTNCGDTGTECTNQDKCSGSGTCADNGFKAEFTACGDGTDRDCDNPDSCNGAGACLNRNEASGFTCRNAADVCDVEETCGLSTTACPPDVLRPNGFACGNSADSECDNPDTCNGSSVACQVNNEPNTTNCGDTGTECTNQDKCDGSGACTDNGYQSAGTGCGDDGDTDCDDPDSCNGSGTCLQNFIAAETACGSSSDTDCDNPDTCDGSGACGANHEVSGFSCRPSVDDCDVAETCDGTGTNCPADALASAGTECRAAADACDVAETCDGATDSCPTDDVATEGTECRGAAGGCDVVETCDGSNVACPADALEVAGEVCREAAGECDVSETCSGSSAACPSNAFEASGTACGNATDTDCDDPDTCNGSGVCRSNVEPTGTACGDDTSNECTSADTCNGSGVCNVNNATNGTSCGEEGTCSVGVCELPEVDAGSDAGSDAGDAGGDDAGAAGGRGGQGGQAGSTGTGDDAGPMAGTGGVAGFPNIFKPDGGLVPDAGAIIAEFVEESGVCECTLPGNMNSSSTGKAGGWALLTLVGLVAVRRRRAA